MFENSVLWIFFFWSFWNIMYQQWCNFWRDCPKSFFNKVLYQDDSILKSLLHRQETHHPKSKPAFVVGCWIHTCFLPKWSIFSLSSSLSRLLLFWSIQLPQFAINICRKSPQANSEVVGWRRNLPLGTFAWGMLSARVSGWAPQAEPGMSQCSWETFTGRIWPWHKQVLIFNVLSVSYGCLLPCFFKNKWIEKSFLRLPVQLFLLNNF